MQLIITEEHLNRAIIEKSMDFKSVSRICPLTQATRDLFPTFDPSLIRTCASYIEVAKQKYAIVESFKSKAARVTVHFDNDRFDDVRKLLPITLELEDN